MNQIRKISIGPDLKNAMNFQIDGPVMSHRFVVSEISDKGSSFDVFVKCTEESDEHSIGEEMLWKSFLKTLPIAIEYSIEF